MANAADRLLPALRGARPTLATHLRTTDREWLWGFDALAKVAVQDPDEVHDEKLWTWLLACGYAAWSRPAPGTSQARPRRADRSARPGWSSKTL